MCCIIDLLLLLLLLLRGQGLGRFRVPSVTLEVIRLENLIAKVLSLFYDDRLL
jgi:hypothetical protein